MTGNSPNKVNIRPKVNVLTVLAHLEYKPWYALAEFVDNSIQSFHDRRAELSHAGTESLRVEIEVDAALQTIRVRDNAAGIAVADFPRAFRPAELPPDTSGLSEFGMGMKTAACWFAPTWRVRTSALDEPVERTVAFDIEQIVEDQLEELEVAEAPVRANAHYTTIELENVRSIPTGRTSGKIQEHLTDIYREFLRDGELELLYRGNVLKYEEPKVLEAPRYDKDNNAVGAPQLWKKTIDFDFGGGLKVHGFAALREKGSTRLAGFSLFRRRRVIEGSADEKYRPREIFGAPNSYETQRLFGELHLTGFPVSHTKAGFRWDENEEVFLELLKEHIDSDELPLLRQARNYRESAARASNQSVLKEVIDETAEALIEHGKSDLDVIVADGPEDDLAPEQMPDASLLADRDFEIEVDDIVWNVHLELSGDLSTRDWLTIAETDDRAAGSANARSLYLRLALENPFMRRLVRLDQADLLEPVVRLAAGIGLSEHLARVGGMRRAGEIRRNLNYLLRGALSRKKRE